MTLAAKTTAVLFFVAFGALWSSTPTFPAHAFAQAMRFDVNDLSYLWPVPTTKTEVAQLVSADEMSAIGSSQIFPKPMLDLLLRTAKGVTVVDSAGRPVRITFGQFETEFSQLDRWKVVAFRVDPSAPGGHSGAVAEFGSTPQLRVIFQPVTTTGTGGVRVHDVTAHLAFSFKKGDEPPAGPGVFPRAIPDKELFRELLEELRTLKSEAESGGATTSGPLRVHPGLQARVPGFAEKARVFLKKRMTEDRLTELAFMGLDPPEPWIFFGMRKVKETFVQTRPRALGGTKDAQMLTFRGGKHVMPEPATSNMVPHGGVSTHMLFPDNPGALDTAVFAAVQRPIRRDIPDIIANPRISHVLNTDCVSCHTESTRRKILNISSDGKFRYAPPPGISGVLDAHVPSRRWNVRNFGWFPSSSEPTVATVTIRTANEAAESADFANREYFGAAPPQQSAAKARGINR